MTTRRLCLNGAVLWSGPSELDGAPIVLLASGLIRGSENSKTGAMVQTYILRSDIDPREAVKSGADSSICGTTQCKQRPAYAREIDAANLEAARAAGLSSPRKVARCYVRTGQGPLVVWLAFRRGSYPSMDPAVCYALSRSRGRRIRFGSYGDPAAVPSQVWLALGIGRGERTGYTHRWTLSNQLQAQCMASVESVAEALHAQSLGWRTFRVRRPGDARMANEIVCPASKEGGHRTTCADCGLCDGARAGGDNRRNIVIFDHGSTARKAATV